MQPLCSPMSLETSKPGEHIVREPSSTRSPRLGGKADTLAEQGRVERDPVKEKKPEGADFLPRVAEVRVEPYKRGLVCIRNQYKGVLGALLDTELSSNSEHLFYVRQGRHKPNSSPWKNNLGLRFSTSSI